jgi:6-phosphogluconolactonase
MTDEFDELFGDLDDELDLTLYADAAELAEEVTVQILAAIEKGAHWWHFRSSNI